MRRLALAAFCGVCVMCAAANAGTKGTTTAFGGNITAKDVQKLKTQIHRLQKIGDEIAKNREAFKKLKIHLEQQGWKGQRPAVKRFNQTQGRRWSQTVNTPRPGQRRTYSRAATPTYRQLSPVRAAYFQRMSQKQNRPAWNGRTWNNTAPRRPFQQKPSHMQGKARAWPEKANAQNTEFDPGTVSPKKKMKKK